MNGLLLLASACWGYIMPKSFKGCSAGQAPKMDYQTRKLACARCPSGRYSHESGWRKPCLVCPHGQMPTHLRDKCWKRKHWNDCAPGYFGPDWSLKPPCRPCPPGRWGTAGTKSKAGCKLCRRGRYGTGGSTTASCKAPCLERRMCGPGATNPNGGQLCRAGKFELETAKPHKSCSLIAPNEYRPKGGYGSAFSEQGACTLDKAYELLDVLFAWKGCATYSDESDSPCFRNQLKSLEMSSIECCDGSEHPVFGKSQKQCEAAMAKWLEAVRKVRVHFHNAMQPKSVWRATATADKDLILPIFRQGIELAYRFYDRDPARWALSISGKQGNPDLTPIAYHMMHEAPNKDSLASIFKSVEDQYCKEVHCNDSFDELEEKKSAAQFYAPSEVESSAPVPTPVPWAEISGRGRMSYEEVAKFAAEQNKHRGEREAGDGGKLAAARAISAAVAAGYDDDTINGNTPNVDLPVAHTGTLQSWEGQKPKIPASLANAALAAGEVAVADDDDDNNVDADAIRTGRKPHHNHKSSVHFFKQHM